MKPETSINYKKIVDDVLEKISRGELQKGDKLPTELCLATKFEVSRTCVREAIKSLEAMGIVQSIQGSGSYITNTPEQSINRPLCALFALSNGTLENVLDLRNVLETDVCRDIIRTASDDEIARLCALADYDYSEPPIKQQAILDSRFHNALMRMSHNALIKYIYRSASRRSTRTTASACWRQHGGATKTTSPAPDTWPSVRHCATGTRTRRPPPCMSIWR